MRTTAFLLLALLPLACGSPGRTGTPVRTDSPAGIDSPVRPDSQTRTDSPTRAGIEQEKERALRKIQAAQPADGDFRFDPPAGWGDNLMRGARVVSISTNESLTEAGRLINGVPSTRWQSVRADLQPAITFDLGRVARFNRLVVFNRCTDSRGTGDGNNATREIGLLATATPDARDFRLLGNFALRGPRPFCVKVGEGQLCTWIDDPRPTIIELKPTRARFVRIVLQRSFWNIDVGEDLRKTIALSQVLLFDARKSLAGPGRSRID